MVVGGKVGGRFALKFHDVTEFTDCHRSLIHQVMGFTCTSECSEWRLVTDVEGAIRVSPGASCSTHNINNISFGPLREAAVIARG